MKEKTAAILRDIFDETETDRPDKSFEWLLQMTADVANQRHGWRFEPHDIVQALAMGVPKLADEKTMKQ